MKMQIIVKIWNEDESELTDSTEIEVNIPEVDAFKSPEDFDNVFDEYERGVIRARNKVVKEATGKYLSTIAKKKPSLSKLCEEEN